MSKPQIILISSKPVFNNEFILPVGCLNVSDTSMLLHVLLMNMKENLSNINNDYELSIFLNNKDQENIPENFLFQDFRFIDPSLGYNNIIPLIRKKILSGNTQFIIIFGNTIGFYPKEYQKILNLLNYDDNTLVLGKSPEEKVSLLGFNFFDEKLFENIYELNPDINNFLKKINTLDYYLFIQNGYPFINNISDFRQLYKILSTKDSIDYCSHMIHEKFTHLFIEYKESL